MNHPVSEALIRVLKQHKIANEEAIVDTIMGCLSVKDQNDILITLRAQINTIEAILDFKEFLSTEIEEINQDEVQSSGSENISSSQKN